jgi:beta-glucosidase/6-phospho-beta-glucosidase/beta-galactosidase
MISMIFSLREDVGTFAEECFRAFGDRVRYWTTINELLTFTLYGYDLGIHAPGRYSPGFGNCTAGNSATEPYIVTHNMLLAHSAAVKTYRTKYQVRLCSVLNTRAPKLNNKIHTSLE